MLFEVLAYPLCEEAPELVVAHFSECVVAAGQGPNHQLYETICCVGLACDGVEILSSNCLRALDVREQPPQPLLHERSGARPKRQFVQDKSSPHSGPQQQEAAACKRVVCAHEKIPLRC